VLTLVKKAANAILAVFAENPAFRLK